MKPTEGEFFRQPGTPLPWVLGKRIGNDWEFVVCASEGPLEIAPLFHDGTEENERGEANGKYIVEACNAYPELKAENDRLKRMAKLDYELVKEFDNYGTGGDLSTCLREMKMQISELRTALKRSEEKQT